MVAEELRPSWGRHLEFIVTCIGFAVGLGNIWRFPHNAYSNGGGAFFIPYVVSLFFMGIPLFCLEILFGQFASLGPVSIWTINPLFKGLGYSMIILSGVISIYYNVIVATAIYYMFASMDSEVPWASCGNDWNTCGCREPGMNTTLVDPLLWFNKSGLNCTGVVVNSSNLVLPSDEYYYNHVLEQTSGLDDLGKVKWELTLCNLAGWVIICVCLIKGVKSMGKAVYFFAIFPYVLLTVLLIRGVTLDGASEGIDFYLNPDFSKLRDSRVWKTAASQIFFSLSCCTGSLTAMSSYNKFNNNVVRDSLIVPILNCLTSFYAGFAIFSVLGFMSHTTGIPVEDVTTDGPGLVFVAYPAALAEMPVPQLWSVLFFFMMVCLGMGTQFPSVETVMTGLQDEFPVLRGKKASYVFRIGVCILGFLLGLPQTTQGGMYLLDLCDIFVGWPLLLIGLLECIAIVWVYTPMRFFEDVRLMFGYSQAGMCLFFGYFSWTLLVATPVLILAILVFDIVDYEPITGEHYPEWSEVLGWLLVVFIMMWTPLWYIVAFLREWCRPGSPSFFKLLRQMNQPTDKWGPKLPENRTIPRYQRYLADTTHQLPYIYPDITSLTQENEKSPPSYEASVGQYNNDAFQGSKPDIAEKTENTHM